MNNQTPASLGCYNTDLALWASFFASYPDRDLTYLGGAVYDGNECVAVFPSHAIAIKTIAAARAEAAAMKRAEVAAPVFSIPGLAPHGSPHYWTRDQAVAILAALGSGDPLPHKGQRLIVNLAPGNEDRALCVTVHTVKSTYGKTLFAGQFYQ